MATNLKVKPVLIAARALALTAMLLQIAQGQTPTREYVYLNGRLVAIETPAPPATVNGATVVGWGSTPSVVTAGHQFTATLVMHNSGTRTWLPATGHRLGAQTPPDNTLWRSQRVELQETSVPPGADAHFTFTATPPSTPGTYSFDWQMVQGGAEWFGGMATRQITVLPNTTAAQFVSFAPATWSATTAIQTVKYNDAGGANDIKDIHVRTGVIPGTVTGSCYWAFDRDTQLVSLYDYGVSPSVTGTLAIGSAGPISSDYCELRNPTMTPEGDLLTVSAQVTLKAASAGSRTIWVMGRDTATAALGTQSWQEAGTWSAFENFAPSPVSVSPANSIGNRQTITAKYRDPNGYANLRSMFLLVNSVLDGVNSCYLMYDRTWNGIALLSDNGAEWQWLGTQPFVENNQCKLYAPGSGSLAAGAGTDLDVNYDIELKQSFSGVKNIYAKVFDWNLVSTDWSSSLGTFTVLSAPISISPTSVDVGQAGAVGQTVQVNANGNWSVSSAPVWMAVSPMSGTNNGVITYTVYPNTGQARDVVITIGSTGNTKDFFVHQASCGSSMIPTQSNVSGGGGIGWISVSTNCASWSASSNVAWAQILDPPPYTVSGMIRFSVAPNTGPARNGTLTIAGAPYWLYQGAATAPPTIYMDYPAAGATLTGDAVAAGWAIDNGNTVEGAVTRVEFLAGVTNMTTVYGVARPDVCAAYPNRVGCNNVGWNLPWDSKLISNGPVTVTATAWDSDVPSQSASVSRSVTVSNPTPPWGRNVCFTSLFLDNPPNDCLKDPIVSATTGTLRVFARGVRNATGVMFPTWSDFNGQDDIVWYPGTKVGLDTDYGGELWMATINLANHKAGDHYYGRFSVHTYMYWAGGSPVFLNYGDFRRQSGATAVGGSAVQNAGLENGNLGSWTAFGATQQSASAVPHSGAYSMRQWSGTGGVYQDIRGLIPGQIYRVKAWVRSESGVVTGQLWAHDTFDANNTSTGVLAIGAAWQQLNIPFTATNGGAIRVHLSKTDSTGVLYWDDISVSGPVPLNPGFENGALTSWSFSNNPELFSASTAQKFAGSYAMRINPGATATAWTDIDGLQAGVIYQVEVWLRGTNVLDTGQVVLHDTTGGNLVQSQFLWQADQEWKRVRLSYTANATGKVRVNLVKGNGSGAIYWDELSLTR